MAPLRRSTMAAGVPAGEREALMQTLADLPKDVSVLLIEHHMKVVMDLCAGSRIYVLNLGSFLAVGSPEEIQSSPDVIKAYLGERKNGH